MHHPIPLRLLPALLVMMLAAFAACTEPSGASPRDLITLTRDSITLVVDPNRGGRLSSLTYGGQEVLSTGDDSTGYSVGSVAWYSPQEDWNWPPPATFDRAAFSVQRVEKHSVLLISDRDSLTGLVLQKRYRLGPDSDIGLTYWLTNKGDTTVSVAPWEVTRIPYDGTITFFSDSLRTLSGKPLTESDDSLHVVHLDERHTGKGKLFASLDSIPVTYVRDGLRFEKHTVVTDYYRVAPGQAPLEIYVDPARRFAEFELQGDYRTLGYDQTTTLRTRWVLGR